MADPKGLLQDTWNGFADHNCPRMAAALSYYTVFSLPALLTVVITTAGWVWGVQAVQGQIEGQIAGLVGPEGAAAIHTMIVHGAYHTGQGLFATVAGIVILLVGAIGAIVELQQGLNDAWSVRPDPATGGWKTFLAKRLFSLAMVLGIAFLLLVSLTLSAALAALGQTFGSFLGAGVSQTLMSGLDATLSFAVITALFAAMYKVLPDAVVRWRDVWVGAAVTAALFVVGKLLLGLYLGRVHVGSAYGTAGSLAIVMVWIYYAGMIFFLGAEMTQAWARHHGGIVPEHGAVRVVEKLQRPGDDPDGRGERAAPRAAPPRSRSSAAAARH